MKWTQWRSNLSEYLGWRWCITSYSSFCYLKWKNCRHEWHYRGTTYITGVRPTLQGTPSTGGKKLLTGLIAIAPILFISVLPIRVLPIREQLSTSDSLLPTVVQLVDICCSNFLKFTARRVERATKVPNTRYDKTNQKHSSTKSNFVSKNM